MRTAIPVSRGVARHHTNDLEIVHHLARLKPGQTLQLDANGQSLQMDTGEGPTLEPERFRQMRIE